MEKRMLPKMKDRAGLVELRVQAEDLEEVVACLARNGWDLYEPWAPVMLALKHRRPMPSPAAPAALRLVVSVETRAA